MNDLPSYEGPAPVMERALSFFNVHDRGRPIPAKRPALEFDARRGLDARPPGMFDLAHLRDKIGGLHQPVRRVPAGKHQMAPGTARRSRMPAFSA